MCAGHPSATRDSEKSLLIQSQLSYFEVADHTYVHDLGFTTAKNEKVDFYMSLP